MMKNRATHSIFLRTIAGIMAHVFMVATVWTTYEPAYAQALQSSISGEASKLESNDTHAIDDQWTAQLLDYLQGQSLQCEGQFRISSQTFDHPVAKAHAELGLMQIFTNDLKTKLSKSNDAHVPQSLTANDHQQMQCVAYRLMDIHHQVIKGIQAKPECFKTSGFDDLSQCQTTYNWSGVTKKVSESLLQDVYRISELVAIDSDDPQTALAIIEKQMPEQFLIWNDLTATLEAHRAKHLLDIPSLLNVFSDNANRTNKYDRTSSYFIEALLTLQQSLGGEELLNHMQKASNIDAYQVSKKDDLANVLGISLQSMEDAAFAIWSQAIRLHGNNYFYAFMHQVPAQKLTTEQKASGKKYNYSSYKTPAQVAVDAICETNPGQWDRPALAQAWVKKCKHDYVTHQGEKIKITTFLRGLFQKFERMHLAPLQEQAVTAENKDQPIQGALFQTKKYPLGKARNNGMHSYQQDIAAFNTRVDALNQMCTQVHQKIAPDHRQHVYARSQHTDAMEKTTHVAYSYPKAIKRLISPALLKSFQDKHAEFIYEDELARMMIMAPSFRQASGRKSYEDMLLDCAKNDPASAQQSGMKKIQPNSSLLAQDRYILQKQLQSFEKAYTYHYKAQYQPNTLNFEETLEYFLQYLPASALQYIVNNPSVDFSKSLAHYIDTYATEEQWHVIEKWIEITVVGLIVGGSIAVYTSGTGLPAVLAVTNMMALALSAYEVVRSPIRLERLYEHNLHMMHGLLINSQPYLEDTILLYENQQSQITWEWVNLYLNMGILPFMARGAVLSVQNLQFQKLVTQSSNALKAGGYSLKDYEALIARIKNHPSFRGMKAPRLPRKGGYAKHPLAEEIKGPRMDGLPDPGSQPSDPFINGPKQYPSQTPRQPGPVPGKGNTSPLSEVKTPSAQASPLKPGSTGTLEKTVAQTQLEGFTLEEILQPLGKPTPAPTSQLSPLKPPTIHTTTVPPALLAPRFNMTNDPAIFSIKAQQDLLAAAHTNLQATHRHSVEDELTPEQTKRLEEIKKEIRTHQDNLRKAQNAINQMDGTIMDTAILSLIRAMAAAGNQKAIEWLNRFSPRGNGNDLWTGVGFPQGYDDKPREGRAVFTLEKQRMVQRWLFKPTQTISKENFWSFYQLASIHSPFQKNLIEALGLSRTKNMYARIPSENAGVFMSHFKKTFGRDLYDFSNQEIINYLQAVQQTVDVIRTAQWHERGDKQAILDYNTQQDQTPIRTEDVQEIILHALTLADLPATKPFDDLLTSDEFNIAVHQKEFLVTKEAQQLADQFANNMNAFRLAHMPIYFHYARLFESQYDNAKKLQQLLGLKQNVFSHLLYVPSGNPFSQELTRHLYLKYPGVQWSAIQDLFRFMQNMQDILFIQRLNNTPDAIVASLSSYYNIDFAKDHPGLEEKIHALVHKRVLNEQNYSYYYKLFGPLHQWYQHVDQLREKSRNYFYDLDQIFKKNQRNLGVSTSLSAPLATSASDKPMPLTDKEISELETFISQNGMLTPSVLEHMNELMLYAEVERNNMDPSLYKLYEQVRFRMYMASHAHDQPELTYYPVKRDFDAEGVAKLLEETFSVLDPSVDKGTWHQRFLPMIERYHVQPFWNLVKWDDPSDRMSKRLHMHIWPNRTLQDPSVERAVNNRGQYQLKNQSDVTQAEVFFLQDPENQTLHFYIEPKGVRRTGKVYAIEFLPFISSIFTQFGLIGGTELDAQSNLRMITLDKDNKPQQDEPLAAYIDNEDTKKPFIHPITESDHIEKISAKYFSDKESLEKILQLAKFMQTGSGGKLSYVECLLLIEGTHLRAQNANNEQGASIQSIKALRRLIDLGVLYGVDEARLTTRVLRLADAGILGAKDTQGLQTAFLPASEKQVARPGVKEEPLVHHEAYLNAQEHALWVDFLASNPTLRRLAHARLNDDGITPTSKKWSLADGKIAYIKGNFDDQNSLSINLDYTANRLEWAVYQLDKMFANQYPPSILVTIEGKEFFVSQALPATKFRYVDQQRNVTSKMTSRHLYEVSINDFISYKGMQEHGKERLAKIGVIDFVLPENLQLFGLLLSLPDQGLRSGLVVGGPNLITLTADKLPYRMSANEKFVTMGGNFAFQAPINFLFKQDTENFMHWLQQYTHVYIDEHEWGTPAMYIQEMLQRNPSFVNTLKEQLTDELIAKLGLSEKDAKQLRANRDQMLYLHRLSPAVTWSQSSNVPMSVVAYSHNHARDSAKKLLKNIHLKPDVDVSLQKLKKLTQMQGTAWSSENFLISIYQALMVQGTAEQKQAVVDLKLHWIKQLSPAFPYRALDQEITQAIETILVALKEDELPMQFSRSPRFGEDNPFEYIALLKPYAYRAKTYFGALKNPDNVSESAKVYRNVLGQVQGMHKQLSLPFDEAAWENTLFHVHQKGNQDTAGAKAVKRMAIEHLEDYWLERLQKDLEWKFNYGLIDQAQRSQLYRYQSGPYQDMAIEKLVESWFERITSQETPILGNKRNKKSDGSSAFNIFQMQNQEMYDGYAEEMQEYQFQYPHIFAEFERLLQNATLSPDPQEFWAKMDQIANPTTYELRQIDFQGSKDLFALISYLSQWPYVHQRAFIDYISISLDDEKIQRFSDIIETLKKIEPRSPGSQKKINDVSNQLFNIKPVNAFELSDQMTMTDNNGRLWFDQKNDILYYRNKVYLLQNMMDLWSRWELASLHYAKDQKSVIRKAFRIIGSPDEDLLHVHMNSKYPQKNQIFERGIGVFYPMSEFIKFADNVFIEMEIIESDKLIPVDLAIDGQVVPVLIAPPGTYEVVDKIINKKDRIVHVYTEDMFGWSTYTDNVFQWHINPSENDAQRLPWVGKNKKDNISASLMRQKALPEAITNLKMAEFNPAMENINNNDLQLFKQMWIDRIAKKQFEQFLKEGQKIYPALADPDTVNQLIRWIYAAQMDKQIRNKEDYIRSLHTFFKHICQVETINPKQLENMYDAFLYNFAAIEDHQAATDPDVVKNDFFESVIKPKTTATNFQNKFDQMFSRNGVELDDQQRQSLQKQYFETINRFAASQTVSKAKLFQAIVALFQTNGVGYFTPLDYIDLTQWAAKALQSHVQIDQDWQEMNALDPELIHQLSIILKSEPQNKKLDDAFEEALNESNKISQFWLYAKSIHMQSSYHAGLKPYEEIRADLIFFMRIMSDKLPSMLKVASVSDWLLVYLMDYQKFSAIDADSFYNLQSVASELLAQEVNKEVRTNQLLGDFLVQNQAWEEVDLLPSDERNNATPWQEEQIRLLIEDMHNDLSRETLSQNVKKTIHAFLSQNPELMPQALSTLQAATVFYNQEFSADRKDLIYLIESMENRSNTEDQIEAVTRWIQSNGQSIYTRDDGQRYEESFGHSLNLIHLSEQERQNILKTWGTYWVSKDKSISIVSNGEKQMLNLYRKVGQEPNQHIREESYFLSTTHMYMENSGMLHITGLDNHDQAHTLVFMHPDFNLENAQKNLTFTHHKNRAGNVREQMHKRNIWLKLVKDVQSKTGLDAKFFTNELMTHLWITKNLSNASYYEISDNAYFENMSAEFKDADSALRSFARTRFPAKREVEEAIVKAAVDLGLLIDKQKLVTQIHYELTDFMEKQIGKQWLAQNQMWTLLESNFKEKLFENDAKVLQTLKTQIHEILSNEQSLQQTNPSAVMQLMYLIVFNPPADVMPVRFERNSNTIYLISKPLLPILLNGIETFALKMRIVIKSNAADYYLNRYIETYAQPLHPGDVNIHGTDAKYILMSFKNYFKTYNMPYGFDGTTGILTAYAPPTIDKPLIDYDNFFAYDFSSMKQTGRIFWLPYISSDQPVKKWITINRDSLPQGNILDVDEGPFPGTPAEGMDQMLSSMRAYENKYLGEQMLNAFGSSSAVDTYMSLDTDAIAGLQQMAHHYYPYDEAKKLDSEATKNKTKPVLTEKTLQNQINMYDLDVLLGVKLTNPKNKTEINSERMFYEAARVVQWIEHSASQEKPEVDLYCLQPSSNKWGGLNPSLPDWSRALFECYERLEHPVLLQRLADNPGFNLIKLRTNQTVYVPYSQHAYQDEGSKDAYQGHPHEGVWLSMPLRSPWVRVDYDIVNHADKKRVIMVRDQDYL